jgi:hypothetical protein
MGLLDGFFSDDPRQQAQLALAMGLLSGGGGKGVGGFARDLGRAGIGAQSAYNQASLLKDKRAEEEQQRKFREMQMGQMQRGIEDQNFAQQLAPNFFQAQNAPADGTGPVAPPKADFAGYGQALAARNPQMGAQFMAMAPKPQGPMKLGRDDRLIDPATNKTIVDAQAPDWQNPEWVKTQMALRAAGRPQVTTNVMPPREVFKDSLGLKKDFDSQPEVKGFKEVQGAWDQISTALQKPSPANDMAAATKFMKLLDPGSVVRESELMMAMQASGAWDRFMNTADRVLKGVKLTPDQRKDFYAAGESLYKASLDRYGQTVQQYEGIAGQYGLDSRFIQNAKPRQSKSGWSIQRAD